MFRAKPITQETRTLYTGERVQLWMTRILAVFDLLPQIIIGGQTLLFFPSPSRM